MYTILILLNLSVNRFFYLLFTRFLRVVYNLSRYAVTCVLLVRIGIKIDKNLKTTLINCLCLVGLGPESSDDPIRACL